MPSRCDCCDVAYELRAEVAKWKHDAELAIDLEYNQGQRVDELRAENKRLAENSYRDLTRIGELLAENERLNRQLALPSALPTTLYGDGVIWN
jgi:hypothetical protein